MSLNIHVVPDCQVCGKGMSDCERLRVIERRNGQKGNPCACGCDVLILAGHAACLN